MRGSRGACQTAATDQLQGDTSDDDGIPGGVAMGDATGPGTPGSSDAPGDCTPRCRRPPRPRRTTRQQTTTESTAISYGTAQALDASGLRDFRVPFVSGTVFDSLGIDASPHGRPKKQHNVPDTFSARG